ncbi:hypothetical protein Bca101_025693 [Brassica carinata]
MGKLVRLCQGEWNKKTDGAWNFHPDQTDFCFGAIIRDNETYQSSEGVVRMWYVLGERTPIVLSYQFPSWILGPLGRRSVPISITTTTDIPVMLRVREWFTELILVVNIGSESIARFHFNRRENFVVGRKSFVVDGTQNEYERREFEIKACRWEEEDEMQQNHEILTIEQEMMVLHRVDLEMDLADSLQRQAERQYEAIAREVILVEDEDDEMDEAHMAPDTVPTITQGESNTPTAENDLPLTQVCETLPDPPPVTDGNTSTVRRRTLETPMVFWEGLLGEDLLLPEGVAPDIGWGSNNMEEEVGRGTETLRLQGGEGGARAS